MKQKFKSFEDLGKVINVANMPIDNLSPRDRVPLAQSGKLAPKIDFDSMGNTGNDGAEPWTNRSIQ